MNTINTTPSDDEYQVELVDPNDLDAEGGYVYGDDADGEGGEWHTQACPCEICRVQRLDDAARHLALSPDEWLIDHMLKARPDLERDFVVGMLPGLNYTPTPPSYRGFSDVLKEVVMKTEYQPALLKRSDGETLLYAGKVNSVYGEPATGKTWVGILAAKEVLRMGGRVLWWDFEDKPDTLYRRAKALGVVDLFTSVDLAFVDGNLNALDDDNQPNPKLIAAVTWLAEVQHNLVVIDTASSSGCPSDGSPIAEWERNMVTPFRSRDVTMLILDHVPKQRQDRPRGPIGSTHKLSELDGAAFVIAGKPWNKTQDGAMVLRLDKDRAGDVPGIQGAKIATIKGWYQGGKLHTSIDAPSDNNVDGDVDMPMLLLVAIGNAGPDGVKGARNLRSLVKGKGQAKDEATLMLIQDGFVVATKVGQANVYTLTDAGRVVFDEEA